ncbi:MAG: galactosyltransferase-related protein [Dermatophilaceae bacterium]
MADSHATVVTVAHGRHDHLAHQLRLLAMSNPLTPHVVVAVGDPGVAAVVHEHRGARRVRVVEHPIHPDGLPIAAARNHGVDVALDEGAAAIVLLDVDCLAGAGTIDRYASLACSGPPAILCGPVTYLPDGVVPPNRPIDLRIHRRPHPARPDPAPGALVACGDHRLFWSLSACVSASTWRLLGGFCEEYVGYGGEDTDLGQIARREGVDLVWVGGADVYHQHHPVSHPPVEHLDAIVRNSWIYRRRWGSWPMEGWLAELAGAGLVRWTEDDLDVVPRHR